MSQTGHTQALYDFAVNIEPVNVVITATLILLVAYKILFHPAGPAAGLTAAFETLVWMVVDFVGLLIKLYAAMGRSLAEMACGNY